MTERQLKRRQAVDLLRIAEVDLINHSAPLSHVLYNIDAARLMVESIMRTRKSEMKDEPHND